MALATQFLDRTVFADLKLRRIFWLASYPKSGNTWVRAFLSAYENGDLDINNMTRVIGDLHSYFYQVTSPTPLDQSGFGQYLCTRLAALSHISALQRDNPLILKTHCANAVIDRVPMIPLQVTKGVVYLVRDPRDVAVSFSEHMGIAIDEAIDKMADPCSGVVTPEHLVHMTSSWSENVMGYLTEKEFRVTLVRYEDLLSDPQGQFKRILDAVGIPFDDFKLHRALDLANLRSLKKQEDERGFGEKKNQERFFNRGTAGHWRDLLSKEQVTRIERDHGEVMQSLGYDLSSSEDMRVAG